MPIPSVISPDKFIFIPNELSSSPLASAKDPPILFFITGNPGLVAYYHAFLSRLTESISRDRPHELGFDTSHCVIASYSLGGFELERKTSLHSLQDQIRLTSSRISDLAKSLIDEYPKAWTKPPQVILLGHSVGAFIALEIVRLWHQKWSAPALDPSPHYGLEATHIQPDAPCEFPGVILLTPTIIDLAESPSGRIITPLLNYVPGFPRYAQAIVTGLIWVFPDFAIRWLVSKLTGMSGPALSTTMTLLSSRSGVHEGLSLAHDEMKEITVDRWGDEVWAATSVSSGVDATATATSEAFVPAATQKTQSRRVRPPKLVFYFADKDHWVADVTREKILRTRGWVGGERVPTMVVEEPGKVVHGWCVAHSVLVADKVRGWVDDILKDPR